MESIQINGEDYKLVEFYIPSQYYSLTLVSKGGLSGTAEFSVMGELPIPDSKYECLYFSRLFVHPQLRGKNLGSFLLDKALDFAQRERKSIINEINPYGEMSLNQLTDFFVRHGFRVLERGVVYWLPK